MNLGDKKPGKTPTKRPLYVYYIIVGVIIVLLNILVVPAIQERSIEKTDYSTFIKSVEKGNVTRATIEEGYIYYEVKSPKTGNTLTCKTVQMDDPDLVNRLLEADVVMDEVLPESPSIFFTLILSYVIPIGIFIFLGRWLSRKMMSSMGNGGPGGAMSFGKSNAKVYVKSSTGIKFSDVAGEDEAKELLTEIVDYLHNPQKYTEIGASMPKGALLVGPPGTGKTLLAKAVAGEAEVPFFSISGSEFVEMFVGMGAAKVRDLFKQANEKAPCIVFIDEIDTIGKKRDGQGLSGNDEREQTLNQLLAEMDGFDGSKGVVLLAATNRPDTLDPALTRPGRFDRRIPVELPDLKGREDILRLHAGNVKCSPSIDFNVIARASAGASGADLANIINEGALLAVRDGRKMVVQKDLEEAIETVIAGEQKKGAVISNHERMIVAYHEIGHALVAAKCKNTAPVHKITIIPRTKGALGYTMQVEEEQHNLVSKEEAYQRIMVYTAGRCAEELIFNSITSGASNDIEQATKLARAMITRLGMSDNFGMTALETVNNAYLGGDSSLACSSETASKIDEEVVNLIKKAHDEAYQILNDNKMKLHELAKFLYERETITGEEFMEILNKPAEIPAQSTRA